MVQKYLKIKLIFASVLVAFSFQIAASQTLNIPENRIIFCLLPLEHADAEELAAVLKPFLSSSGTIAPFTHSNTLIIKDKVSIVKQLIKAVKGSEDLRVCQNFQETPDD